MEKRYLVWFFDCDSVVYFDNERDARHYARHNDGNVTDTETGLIIWEYSEPLE